MRISLFFVSFLLLTAASRAAPATERKPKLPALPPPTSSGCLTASQITALLDDLSKRARRLHLEDSIKCLLKRGNNFQPLKRRRAPDGGPCYDHDAFKIYMADAAQPCIVDLLDLEKPTPPSDAPTTPYSNPEEVKTKDLLKECTRCDSGCHFCCINSGIGGNDACFFSHCYPGFLAKTNKCT